MTGGLEASVATSGREGEGLGGRLPLGKKRVLQKAFYALRTIG